MERKFNIAEEFVGFRIDKFLGAKFSDVSRSKLQKLIIEGAVLVNGVSRKSKYVLRLFDEVVVVNLPVCKRLDLVPEDFSLPIAFEDESILIIEKPAGMVVHPDDEGNHLVGTVSNQVVSRVSPNVGHILRPGIVHRLDKDTSGLLVVAKTQDSYLDLVDQFKTRRVLKVYTALVAGFLKEAEGRVEAPLSRHSRDRKKMTISCSVNDGKAAVSVYKVLKEYDLNDFKSSLVDVKIMTGRTHQIRVHMSSIGHSVLGDDVYGSRKLNSIMKDMFGLSRQFLHARMLKLKSPFSGELVEVSCALPKDLQCVVDKIEALNV